MLDPIESILSDLVYLRARIETIQRLAGSTPTAPTDASVHSGQCGQVAENHAPFIARGARSMTYEQPVFTLRRAFATGPIASVFGTDGLLELVPTLDPDIYEIAQAGQVWGIASVYADRTWAIDSEGFKAGPGYIIV